MKIKSTALIILILPFLVIAQSQPDISVEEIKGHISYLASDEMAGRWSGSEELYKAADYIKNEFTEYGLSPIFDGSFFQEFEFIESVKMLDGNSFNVIAGDESYSAKLEDEFIPFSFSGSFEKEAEVVFVGYGISAPDLGYDDYEGIDVTDKFVLAMRYHPEMDSVTSKFDRLASFRVKASTAKMKGAAGIIFATPPEPVNDDILKKLRYDGAPSISDLAVINVKREIADKILAPQGITLAQAQKKILEKNSPNSFVVSGAKVKSNTNLELVKTKTINVAGVLEGSDETLKNEYIVIGAHFDHLGHGFTGSRYQGEEMLIHNGADDNASGTTGVLEIAEKFSSVKDQIRRSIIFIAFSGEELGLLGSNYFVNNSPVDISQISSMINMDMIGRISDENNLTIIGVGTAAIWKDMMNRINEDYGFELGFNESGFGGSDHMSFSMKKIPVLFFFTGIHEDYHMPSDDTDKINFEGEKQILDFVFDTASELAVVDDRPEFVEVKKEEQSRPARSRIKVGTIPEFAYTGSGYKISGVTPGSPAEKAGLQANDIIIKFAGIDVANIYDFMNGMAKVSPGDTIECIVIRDEKEMKFDLELVAN